MVAYYKFVRVVVNHDDRVSDVKFAEPDIHVFVWTPRDHDSLIFESRTVFSVQQLIVAAHFILEVAAHDRNGQATVNQQL